MQLLQEIKMKQVFLTEIVLLLAAAGPVQAQEGELHGVIELTYQSKYVWRGFDVYGDKSAIQPAIDLDLFGTGFGISAMGHRANSDKFENRERWDYTLYYYNSLFDDEPYATNYRINWVYYNCPDGDKKEYDLQEVFAFLSWPNILPVEGLVPSYVLAKAWPSWSGSLAGSRSPLGGTASGFCQIFMLDYCLSVQNLLPDIPEQVLRLHSEIVFNDGVGPAGQNIDHDWSNAVFGIATDFDLGNNLTFTPAVYHQITMDKSVNDDKDETWVSLSVKYRF